MFYGTLKSSGNTVICGTEFYLICDKFVASSYGVKLVKIRGHSYIITNDIKRGVTVALSRISVFDARTVPTDVATCK